MPTTIEPIIYKCKETKGYLKTLKEDIIRKIDADADLLLEYPVVYMHVWRSSTDVLNNQYHVYVGEADNVVRRQEEHWRDAADPSKWQYKMAHDKDENGQTVIPTLYIIGHQYFHKSLTLDIENKLISFCIAMQTAKTANGRLNPQGKYHGDDALDSIFGYIWRYLKRDNPDLFLPETQIMKSAIYKASPNHKLTDDQKNAKDRIINRVFDALINHRDHQLIMVEGEAGTGKTVLTSSTFYDLLGRIDGEQIYDSDINAFLLVNHDEQLGVYANMAAQMGYKKEIVMKPTRFIGTHQAGQLADVVFIDESHLLWTQKKQAYNMGNNQLEDIMDRARVTVIMFDEYQVLRKEQFIEPWYIKKIRGLSSGQDNYIPLINQLRMNCDTDTMKWIDSFTKDLVISDLHRDTKGYDIQIFDTPDALHEAINKKAKESESELSRLIASYDWQYNGESGPDGKQKYWEVAINKDGHKWSMPWNRELLRYAKSNDFDSTCHEQLQNLNRREQMKLKVLDWAEMPHTIDEVGSTFTIQGFDLTYAGVIIGPSVEFDSNTQKIKFNIAEKWYDQMKGNRTMSDGTSQDVGHVLIKNELRVLMTRGTKGLYIYAYNDELRDALKNAIG